MKFLKRHVLLLVFLLLIATIGLAGMACNAPKETDAVTTEPSVTEAAEPEETETEDPKAEETTAEEPEAENELGTGETTFIVEVTAEDGKKKTFTVHTDKENVGDALLEVGLIEGEEGNYGLMVVTVDGTTVRYEDGGKYWAFYINGEYAMTGVSATPVESGAAYGFKVE